MKALVGVVFGKARTEQEVERMQEEFQVELPTDLVAVSKVTADEFSFYIGLPEPPAPVGVADLVIGFSFWFKGQKVTPTRIESDVVDGAPCTYAWFVRPVAPGDHFRMHVRYDIQKDIDWN
jgi:hypothetical protein